jgi:hypothetical protein
MPLCATVKANEIARHSLDGLPWMEGQEMPVKLFLNSVYSMRAITQTTTTRNCVFCQHIYSMCLLVFLKDLEGCTPDW